MSAQAKELFSPIEAPHRAQWQERVSHPPRDLTGINRLRSVVAEGGLHRAVLLDGAEKDGLLAGALLARRRPRPIVVFAEATWKVGRNPLDQLATRFGLRMLDGPHVRYCVLSSRELELFPRTWHVDPARVAFTPYHYTLSPAELKDARPGDGSLFTGGVSLRDYGTLVEAMRSVSSPLTIATRGRPRWARQVPATVTVRETTPREYNELTAAASVVVVPLELRDDRSAGQATYLNAMALGKAVVVSDVAGARDHVRDGETGVLVPPGDPERMALALNTLLADRGYARRLGQAAREDVLARFGPDRYVERLLEVVDDALAGAPAG